MTHDKDQAPDKAAERERVDETVFARMDKAVAAIGTAPSEDEQNDLYEAWCAVCQSLAPKPTGTGTEAGRGALTEALTAIEFALEIDDHYDMREFLKGWSEGDTSEWPEFAVALANATPTPPTPDSTAQGDGTSQEGTR